MAGFELSVKSDVTQVTRWLTDIQKKQIPFATAKALTETAKTVQSAEISEIKRAFDKPTPFTLKSTYMSPATKTKQEAVVWLRGWAPKGTAATKYLGPHVFGGDRPLKKFEAALQRIGILPKGMYAVPGQGADMDTYGNMSRGQIVQIMSYMSAFGEQGYKANMNEKGRARLSKGKKGQQGFEYFVVRKDARNLQPGIYKRISFRFGKSIKPILIFVRKPQYKKRLQFNETAQRISAKRFMPEFEKALAQALATART